MCCSIFSRAAITYKEKINVALLVTCNFRAAEDFATRCFDCHRRMYVHLLFPNVSPNGVTRKCYRARPTVSVCYVCLTFQTLGCCLSHQMKYIYILLKLDSVQVKIDAHYVYSKITFAQKTYIFASKTSLLCPWYPTNVTSRMLCLKFSGMFNCPNLFRVQCSCSVKLRWMEKQCSK